MCNPSSEATSGFSFIRPNCAEGLDNMIDCNFIYWSIPNDWKGVSFYRGLPLAFMLFVGKFCEFKL